jgi:hypothetical protein
MYSPMEPVRGRIAEVSLTTETRAGSGSSYRLSESDSYHLRQGTGSFGSR